MSIFIPYPTVSFACFGISVWKSWEVELGVHAVRAKAGSYWLQFSWITKLRGACSSTFDFSYTMRQLAFAFTFSKKGPIVRI